MAAATISSLESEMERLAGLLFGFSVSEPTSPLVDPRDDRLSYAAHRLLKDALSVAEAAHRASWELLDTEIPAEHEDRVHGIASMLRVVLTALGSMVHHFTGDVEEARELYFAVRWLYGEVERVGDAVRGEEDTDG